MSQNTFFFCLKNISDSSSFKIKFLELSLMSKAPSVFILFAFKIFKIAYIYSSKIYLNFIIIIIHVVDHHYYYFHQSFENFIHFFNISFVFGNLIHIKIRKDIIILA